MEKKQGRITTNPITAFLSFPSDGGIPTGCICNSPRQCSLFGIINMREKMWVTLKVKATRYPRYSADNFLHSDDCRSEGELSSSVGRRTHKNAVRFHTTRSQRRVMTITILELITMHCLNLEDRTEMLSRNVVNQLPTYVITQ